MYLEGNGRQDSRQVQSQVFLWPHHILRSHNHMCVWIIVNTPCLSVVSNHTAFLQLLFSPCRGLGLGALVRVGPARYVLVFEKNFFSLIFR